jgi:hypothetical protein
MQHRTSSHELKLHYLYYLVGTEKKTWKNDFGIEIDLTWLPIVSTCLSVLGILTGALWIVAPIEKTTNSIIGKIIFLPIFFYRLLVWQIILIILNSFSFFAFAGFAFLNWIVLFLFIQDQLIVEPINHALLSLVFPVFKLPSTKVGDDFSLKIFFWMIVTGNSFLLLIHGTLYTLYHFDIYNPWCREDLSELLMPEELFQNVHFFFMALFAAATLPTTIGFCLQKK